MNFINIFDIRTRLVLGIITIVLLLEGIAGIGIYRSMAYLKDSYGHHSQWIAQKMLHDMYYSISQTLEGITNEISNDPVVECYLQNNMQNCDGYDKKNSLSEYLQAHYMNKYAIRYGYNVFQDIMLAYPNGDVITQVNQSYNSQKYTEWIQIAFKKGVYIGDLQYTFASKEYSLPFASRVSIKNKFQFVLLIRGSSRWFVKQLENMICGIQAIDMKLITKKGELLLSTTPYKFMEDISKQPFFITFSKIDTSETQGGCYVEDDDESYKLYSWKTLKAFKNMQGLKWTLFVIDDLNDLQKPIAKFRSIILISSFFVIIISILITYVITKSITKPIDTLCQAVALVSQGDLSIKIENQFKDEFKDLTDGFNKMTGRLKTLYLVLEDEIEERKRIEEALTESEGRFKAFFHATFEGIVLTDQGIVIDSNEQYASMFGYNSNELIKTKMIDLIYNEDRDFVKQNLLKGYDKPYEFRAIHKNGNIFYVEVHSGLVPYQNRMLKVTAVRNVTERKQMQAELLERNKELAKSNQELDDFAYIASHDLKEPLRGIRYLSKYLIDEYQQKLDEKAQNKINMISRLCLRSENLIEALHYYSQVGRLGLSFQDTDLNEVINEVLESIKVLVEENNGEIRIPKPLPIIKCDRVRVGEIFKNLLVNALKYNDKPQKWVEIGSEIKDKEIMFYVKDNGIGIPERNLVSIFKIFQRLHPDGAYGGGTGVGLTIVQKLVHRHGGTIHAESTFGEGTTFYFTLKKDPKELAENQNI